MARLLPGSNIRLTWDMQHGIDCLWLLEEVDSKGICLVSRVDNPNVKIFVAVQDMHNHYPPDWPYNTTIKEEMKFDDAYNESVCYPHDPCDENGVLRRMDKDSELWYYCKKCGEWTAPFQRPVKRY